MSRSAISALVGRTGIPVNLQSGRESFHTSTHSQNRTMEDNHLLNYVTDKSEFNFDPKLYEENNWCPVYKIGRTDKGGTVWMVNITDSISEIHEYIPLLDTLYQADVNDIIELNIASPGGYISTATQICTAIKQCKGTVIGHASGMCASAGSLIWSVCHQVSVGDGANFMWHMSSHADHDNSLAVRNEADFQIEYVREVLLGISIKRGFITEEEVEELCTNPQAARWIPALEMRERLAQAEGAE